jgi:NADH:ubiquinone oxidoreductase subunit 4 (subunit M)
MVPLIAAIVWLGVYPAPVLRRMQGAAEKFVTSVNAHRDVVAEGPR